MASPRQTNPQEILDLAIQEHLEQYSDIRFRQSVEDYFENKGTREYFEQLIISMADYRANQATSNHSPRLSRLNKQSIVAVMLDEWQKRFKHFDPASYPSVEKYNESFEKMKEIDLRSGIHLFAPKKQSDEKDKPNLIETPWLRSAMGGTATTLGSCAVGGFIYLGLNVLTGGLINVPIAIGLAVAATVFTLAVVSGSVGGIVVDMAADAVFGKKPIEKKPVGIPSSNARLAISDPNFTPVPATPVQPLSQVPASKMQAILTLLADFETKHAALLQAKGQHTGVKFFIRSLRTELNCSGHPIETIIKNFVKDVANYKKTWISENAEMYQAFANLVTSIESRFPSLHSNNLDELEPQSAVGLGMRKPK